MDSSFCEDFIPKISLDGKLEASFTPNSKKGKDSNRVEKMYFILNALSKLDIDIKWWVMATNKRLNSKFYQLTSSSIELFIGLWIIIRLDSRSIDLYDEIDNDIFLHSNELLNHELWMNLILF